MIFHALGEGINDKTFQSQCRAVLSLTTHISDFCTNAAFLPKASHAYSVVYDPENAIVKLFVRYLHLQKSHQPDELTKSTHYRP